MLHQQGNICDAQPIISSMNQHGLRHSIREGLQPPIFKIIDPAGGRFVSNDKERWPLHLTQYIIH
uniref:Uncharacterized protein n=1 Tax=Ciona intestinalis TaxID=7719 RepID=H2XM69_CIOIN